MEPRDLCGDDRDSGDGGSGNGSTGESKGRDPSTPSQATRLVQLAEKAGAVLFHDDRGDSWIQFPLPDHREHWPCRSKRAKQWLAHLFWRIDGKAPNSDAVRAATNLLEAQAHFDGPEYVLHNRTARRDGAIWYDLCNPKWQAVRITKDGWSIEPNPPILFRRFIHQRPQVQPVPGGDLRRILSFVNLRNPKQRVLFLVYIPACFVPDIPHPIPVVHGPQGAAKTTLLRKARRIIDPSITETLTLPTDKNELVQQLDHHWAPYYDNLTSLPEWLSDCLCRAVTGEGSSKRELFTNDDDIIYSYRRCVALNGINIAAAKPDLLDRALLLGLEEIPENQRRAENEMWAEFEEARPYLVGAVLDVLSRALGVLPTIQLPKLPRMADFTLWGCAIAESLGITQQEFLDALAENFEDRNEEILVSDPVGTTVRTWMEDRNEWSGLASELLAELEPVAQRCRISTRSKRWPQTANSLSRRLNVVASNLAVAGIVINRPPREARRRTMTIRRTGPALDPNSTLVGDVAHDDLLARNESSPTSSQQKGLSFKANDDDDDSDDVSGSPEGGTPIPGLGQGALKCTRNTVTTVTTVIPAAAPGFSDDDTDDDEEGGSEGEEDVVL